MSDEHAFPIRDMKPEDQELLNQLAAQAHAAGNASVAANPEDKAHWMLFDGNVSIPVVHDDFCYICRDPEFAQMGMPLCTGCPACVRAGRGLGHVPADDDTCSMCHMTDGPENYDDEGLIIGLPRAEAVTIWNLLHPKHPKEA